MDDLGDEKMEGNEKETIEAAIKDLEAVIKGDDKASHRGQDQGPDRRLQAR